MIQASEIRLRGKGGKEKKGKNRDWGGMDGFTECLLCAWHSVYSLKIFSPLPGFKLWIKPFPTWSHLIHNLR